MNLNQMPVKPWSGRSASEALRQVKAKGRRAKTPCVICELSIDYSLTYPHPQSCSVQHVKPRKLFPQLTWDPTNWAPAHLDCNKSAGPNIQTGLGVKDDW